MSRVSIESITRWCVDLSLVRTEKTVAFCNRSQVNFFFLFNLLPTGRHRQEERREKILRCSSNTSLVLLLILDLHPTISSWLPVCPPVGASATITIHDNNVCSSGQDSSHTFHCSFVSFAVCGTPASFLIHVPRRIIINATHDVRDCVNQSEILYTNQMIRNLDANSSLARPYQQDAVTDPWFLQLVLFLLHRLGSPLIRSSASSFTFR